MRIPGHPHSTFSHPLSTSLVLLFPVQKNKGKKVSEKNTSNFLFFLLIIFISSIFRELILTNVQQHIDILNQHQMSVMKFIRNDQ